MADDITDLAEYAAELLADHDHANCHVSTETLRPVIEAVLAEASAQRWLNKQLAETGIRAMDFRNGASMELEPAREMVAHWVGAARGMLGDAPNYSETPIEMVVKVGEDPERFAFTLQRVGKLTPHQARQQAERERDSVLRLVAGWYASSEGRHVLAEDLAAAGYPLSEADPS